MRKAAALVPDAEVVVEPTLVTEPLDELSDGHNVLAGGPEPMWRPSESSCRARTRLGGADGLRLRRLLRMLGGDRRRPEASLRRRPSPGGGVIVNASGCLDALEAPEVARSLDAFVTKTVTPQPRRGTGPCASPRPSTGCSTRSGSRTRGSRRSWPTSFREWPSWGCPSGSRSGGSPPPTTRSCAPLSTSVTR